jgi:hypothetical protein
MAIQDDFEIQADGDIRHTSGTGTYTVLELHRWLQDEADDAVAAGDDFIDITYTTPSERATDNIITLLAPFNIDDTAAQYLYDGSITQTNPLEGGTDIYAGLVVVGSGAVAADLRITQDEAIVTPTLRNSGNPDAAAAILARFLVKARSVGADINGRRVIVWARKLGDTYAEFSVTLATGNNVAAIFTAADLNNDTVEATIAGWTDIVNVEGYQLLDIAGDGSADEPYYSEWDQASRTKKQLYERTKWLARQGTGETLHGLPGEEFRGITHEFTYDGQSTNFATNDTVVWGTSFAYDGGTGTVPVVGHYIENTLSGGVGKVVFVSAAAGATGTIVVQREAATPAWGDNDTYSIITPGVTGAFVQAGAATAPVSATLGGAAVVLADDDNGADGTLWVQSVSGSILGDNDPIWRRGGTTGSYALASGAATPRTVKPEFLGVFTGAAIIGAFGIGIDAADGIAADVFTTLGNATVSPPNQQQLRIQGLVSGDRVLVTNYDGGALAPDYDQFTLDTSLTGAAEVAVVITTAIPVDTPLTGNLRIQLDTGIYRLVPYTTWSGSTFTIDPTDFTGGNAATAPRNVFLGYIDIQTATTFETVAIKYSSDRDVFVRVRDGGATPIKTFDTSGTFGSGGLTVTAIRTSDA